MTDTPDHLANKLLTEGEKTVAFFRTITSEQWAQQVYTEGSGWTVQQVLAHFVAAEKSLYRLITNILEGGGGSPPDFALDTYNERKVVELQEASPRELMERFVASRQETANLVRSMQPEDLARTGRHPFLGMTPLEDIIKLIYRHNGIHIREVRSKITTDRRTDK